MADPTTAALTNQQADGTGIIEWDAYLAPYANRLRRRFALYREKRQEIERVEGSLEHFSRGYERLGFNKTPQGVWYREWAPGAREASLIGDFNGWNPQAHRMERDQFGTFQIFIPNNADGSCAIPHLSRVKISLLLQNWDRVDRIPAWMRYVVQEKGSLAYVGVFWDPPPSVAYRPQFPRPARPTGLRIYESHIGMSSLEPKVASYREFTRDILPYVKDLGYNAIQLMAIMEHAYYASFGYHVTNFFAASSRFGTPDDLKALIDEAHRLGIVVLIDIVHSHASKNVLDGLNYFDGTDHQYFHSGGKGNHDLWDSRLFNYGHWEVLRFLLSNLRFWIEEYGFDGFRFDGVTSMLYIHHGIAASFGNYDNYFNETVDDEAVTYIMLANAMLHELYGDFIISIAEDVSGMPGLCRPISEGGLGFDYRLAMAIPDKWIELFKTLVRDEDWNMGSICWALSNRRYKEKHIAYAESHDQALVGDKTIAFWLMDKEMYWNMSTLSPLTPIIDRGIALHKMIRLITCALGGEGYLTFMGNEFGHPEWIDFPREGNGSSFQHCRRRWDLARDHLLRYRFLLNFDRAMIHLEDKFKWLSSDYVFITLKHESDKMIVFERGPLLFVFNFHPSTSFTDYRIGVSKYGIYRIVLDSDWKDEFGGHGRVDRNTEFQAVADPWHGKPYYITIYSPCRSAQVFEMEETFLEPFKF